MSLWHAVSNKNQAQLSTADVVILHYYVITQFDVVILRDRKKTKFDAPLRSKFIQGAWHLTYEI